MSDKTAIYIRLSDFDTNVKNGIASESNSISNQRIMLCTYIKNHPDLKNTEIIEYVDDGTSGTLFQKRTEFQRMMDDAEKGMFNCIVVKDLSRLGRDYIEVGYYTEIVLPSLQVRFIAVADNLDSDDYKGTTNGMDYALKNLLNQFYSADISKKVKASLKMLQKQGEYVGSIAPYGYMKDPNDRHKLIINEKEAEIVKIIFEMAAQGKSGAQVAKYLNEKGISSNRKNDICRWDSKTVLKKIRNEIYIGTLVQGKAENVGVGDEKRKIPTAPDKWIKTENAVEPIVSKELFDKANANFPQYKRTKKSADTVNLFVCPYCGRKMKLQYGGRRYQCRMKNMSPHEDCQTLFAQKDDLHQAVLETVRKHIEVAVGRYIEVQKNADNETDTINKTIMKLNKEVGTLENAPFGLYDEYRTGRITKEQFISQRETAKIRLEEAKAEIKALKNKLTHLNITSKETIDLLSCPELTEYDGKILSEFIEKVEVYSQDRIKIHFKCKNFFEDIINRIE